MHNSNYPIFHPRKRKSAQIAPKLFLIPGVFTLEAALFEQLQCAISYFRHVLRQQPSQFRALPSPHPMGRGTEGEGFMRGHGNYPLPRDFPIPTALLPLSVARINKFDLT